MKTILMINSLNLTMFLMSNNTLMMNLMLFSSSITSMMIMNSYTNNQIMTLMPILIISSGLLINYLYINSLTPNKFIKVNMVKIMCLVTLMTPQTITLLKINKSIYKINNETSENFIMMIMIMTLMIMILNYMLKKNHGPMKKMY